MRVAEVCLRMGLVGPVDQARAPGAGDSRFESWADHEFLIRLSCSQHCTQQQRLHKVAKRLQDTAQNTRMPRSQAAGICCAVWRSISFPKARKIEAKIRRAS